MTKNDYQILFFINLDNLVELKFGEQACDRIKRRIPRIVLRCSTKATLIYTYTNRIMKTFMIVLHRYLSLGQLLVGYFQFS